MKILISLLQLSSLLKDKFELNKNKSYAKYEVSEYCYCHFICLYNK